VSPAQAGSVIGAEAERLERLVLDLLELARLRREEFTVAQARLDLASIAAQAVQRPTRRCSATPTAHASWAWG
jgi:two-component system OmpR family sensor kinase